MIESDLKLVAAPHISSPDVQRLNIALLASWTWDLHGIVAISSHELYEARSVT